MGEPVFVSEAEGGDLGLPLLGDMFHALNGKKIKIFTIQGLSTVRYRSKMPKAITFARLVLKLDRLASFRVWHSQSSFEAHRYTEDLKKAGL